MRRSRIIIVLDIAADDCVFKPTPGVVLALDIAIDNVGADGVVVSNP